MVTLVDQNACVDSQLHPIQDQLHEIHDTASQLRAWVCIDHSK
jgi:hypothetical protein